MERKQQTEGQRLDARKRDLRKRQQDLLDQETRTPKNKPNAAIDESMKEISKNLKAAYEIMTGSGVDEVKLKEYMRHLTFIKRSVKDLKEKAERG